MKSARVREQRMMVLTMGSLSQWRMVKRRTRVRKYMRILLKIREARLLKSQNS